MTKIVRMARVYRWIKTEDLELLRSRHCVKLRNAQNRLGYLAEQEARRLEFHIHEIDVELASREAQNKLL